MTGFRCHSPSLHSSFVHEPRIQLSAGRGTHRPSRMTDVDAWISGTMRARATSPFRLSRRWPVAVVTLIPFVLLFELPVLSLVQDWWTLPEAGHGLLLAPIAAWIVFRDGIAADASPNRPVGLGVLLVAVLMRYASGLAAELFTMRLSVVIALAGLTIFYAGIQQMRRWWLSYVLILLSIPLPELITQAVALPLQFRASRLGARLLEMRNVPVVLSGNVILLPGRELFVTEACSGLRSITALLSVSVLLSRIALHSTLGRLLLVLGAFPIAIVVNGIRVFMTGFLVFYVSPSLGNGFMHDSEGWMLFIASMGALAIAAWFGRAVEGRAVAWRARRRMRSA